jgi:ABC-type dipeptide/oligopeptide/nickel transport system permease component
VARFLARRLLQLVFVLLGATGVLFTCLFVVPGDPLTAMQGDGPRLDAGTRQALAHRYELDRSLPRQYVSYLDRLAHGDLGESYRLRRPVNDVLGAKVRNSARLAVAAVAFEIGIGTVAAVVASVRRASLLDVLVTVSTTLALGVPAFVVGLLLQHVFAVRWHLLPLGGQRLGLRSLLLPALTLGAAQAAILSRVLRSMLLEAMAADYTRTARAKGLSPAGVLMHALRTSMVPAMTYVGIGFGALLGGAAVVETIFNWDGVGLAMVTAITSQDNAVVIGVVTYVLIAFVLVNVAVDLVAAAVDPRIRP